MRPTSARVIATTGIIITDVTTCTSGIGITGIATSGIIAPTAIIGTTGITGITNRALFTIAWESVEQEPLFAAPAPARVYIGRMKLPVPMRLRGQGQTVDQAVFWWVIT
jgi:hypothetical protein